jgi:hypothetical protein
MIHSSRADGRDSLVNAEGTDVSEDDAPGKLIGAHGTGCLSVRALPADELKQLLPGREWCLISVEPVEAEPLAAVDVGVLKLGESSLREPPADRRV